MTIFQADMIFDFMKIINFGIRITICPWFRYHLRKLKKWNIFLPCLGWFSLKSLEVLWFKCGVYYNINAWKTFLIVYFGQTEQSFPSQLAYSVSCEPLVMQPCMQAPGKYTHENMMKTDFVIRKWECKVAVAWWRRSHLETLLSLRWKKVGVACKNVTHGAIVETYQQVLWKRFSLPTSANRGIARRGTDLYAHEFAPLSGFLFV